jgi:hypothetical protein
MAGCGETTSFGDQHVLIMATDCPAGPTGGLLDDIG